MYTGLGDAQADQYQAALAAGLQAAGQQLMPQFYPAGGGIVPSAVPPGALGPTGQGATVNVSGAGFFSTSNPVFRLALGGGLGYYLGGKKATSAGIGAALAYFLLQ